MMSSSVTLAGKEVSKRAGYRVLEFYSGLGGWTCALQGSKIDNQYEVLSAFDLNTIANAVYRINNHGGTLTPNPRSIDQLTAWGLDQYQANVWLMSPPCQPFTRQNTTQCRDKEDPRSSSFQSLFTQLPLMRCPPTYIALENVVGFEESECCQQWLETLFGMGYEVEHFHLTPLQFGIPNARPRYYCIAWRREGDEGLTKDAAKAKEKATNLLLRTSLTDKNESIEHPLYQMKTLSEYLKRETEMTDKELRELIVPQSVITSKSASWCFDIQTANSTYSACFTKSYSRYIKGTGSVLLFQCQSPRPGAADYAGLEALSTTPVLTKEGSSEREGSERGGDECSCRKRIRKENVEGDEQEEGEEEELYPLQSVKDGERDRVFDAQWWKKYTMTCTISGEKDIEGCTYLRYFSPKELLNLFGFPESYHFPEPNVVTATTANDASSEEVGNIIESDKMKKGKKQKKPKVPPAIVVSQKKRYELIGNSVNVTVVRHIIDRLFGKEC